MRLDEYMDIERDERAERRRLAEEKSYGILDHLETFQDRFEETVQGDSLYGGVSPSIFVGRSNYPNVSTGILSPVGHDEDAASFETSAAWYDEGVSIDDVFQRRTSLLNSNRGTKVTNVADSWDGFLGTQREVAIADRPVTVEIGLDGKPSLDLDGVEIYRNEFIGNAFWVILAPGRWEFELIELKAPGSVWNPDPEAGMYLAADREGYEGRTGYVNETAGAYHASRLGVLEHLQERGRQAKALVIRHVSDDYWGPVGVWQIRESIRHAFEGEMADAETFGDAVRDVTEYLPVSLADLRRKSTMAAGLQTDIFDFA